MYEPEVSIITPTHNIVEAGNADDFMILISMLARQTYPYIEHIVMDNASTDETVTLLKDYKNSGYISFFSAPDSGKFEAINNGLVRAKGKYVAFLSCDDFYHDVTGIEDVVNAMEENDADFCFFPAYCIIAPKEVMLFNPSIYNVFQVMPFSRQAAIYKKETLEKLGYFDSKFKLFADYDLLMRLVLSGANGIYFNRNIVTYKMGVKAQKYTSQIMAETSHIYHKNLRALYPLNENEIDRMVRISEIPRPLLEKLAQFFPPEDHDLFFERCEQMSQMRRDTIEQLKAQEQQ